MSNYLKNLLKDKNVASITPTSTRVVKSVCEPIDFSKDINVVEYGPGNGVFTHYLLKKMTADSRIILIETNEDFVGMLNKIEDKRVTVVQDSAENVRAITKKAGIEKIDYIISGIPFSFLKPDIKIRILAESKNLLTGEGRFLAYQTSNHLEKYLKRYFKVVKTNYKYLNIPPMCVYDAHGKKN